MTLPVPEFSPAMLSLFLRARAAFAASVAGRPAGKEFCGRLRKAARVTVAEFDMAWMGRLQSVSPRARLWGALGLVPAKHGVELTHGGQCLSSGASDTAREAEADEGR